MAGEDGKEYTYELVTTSGTFPAANNWNGDGKATVIYSAGENEGKTETYEGTYCEAKRSGYGKYTYFNGDVFSGMWDEGTKKGYGEMVYAAPKEEGEGEEGAEGKKRGGKYFGNYGAITSADGVSGALSGDENVRNGEGTFVYTNGDRYSGGWSKGKKAGQGTYFFKHDRTRLVGTWKDGKIETGKWIFPNGTYYIGKFENGKPNGVGNWVFKNGHQLAGSYTQKKLGEEEAAGEDGGEEKPVEVEAQWASASIISVA